MTNAILCGIELPRSTSAEEGASEIRLAIFVLSVAEYLRAAPAGGRALQLHTCPQASALGKQMVLEPRHM